MKSAVYFFVVPNSTFSDIKIAPKWSNLTVIGSLYSRLMIFNNILMNFTSLTASDNATYSASLELNVTIHPVLEIQLIVALFKIIINPDRMILDYLLNKKSLSLYVTLFMIFSFFLWCHFQSLISRANHILYYTFHLFHCVSCWSII